MNDQIVKLITTCLGQEYLSKLELEHPKDEGNGDYASNIALVEAKRLGRNPRELASEIVAKLSQCPQIGEVCQKIEVAGPGFINFYLKDEVLLEEILKVNEQYGQNDSLAGKTVIVEYTDPNPFKEMHIGHLMSNTIGEAIARLKKAQGARVVRANYQGDVGLHVAKSIWGMKVGLSIYDQVLLPSDQWKACDAKEEILLDNLQRLGEETINTKQRFMGQAYAYGATKYEEDESVKEEINALNKVIYDGSDPVVMKLYHKGREWSLLYFEVIYKRLGTKFDEYFFESETGVVGQKVVDEALGKKILTVGEGGAVVYLGEQDGLHTRVFRNKLGLPTYEAKDLGLAITKWERHKYDVSIVITANEIADYFRVILSVLNKLRPELGLRTIHKPHGVMKLKGGKMSSRTGKVVTAEILLNELLSVVVSKMGERDLVSKKEVADKIAVSALKYGILKSSIGGDIVYDPTGMTKLEGDTGPYLQYTYARIQSVMAKVKATDKTEKFAKQELTMNGEEAALVRYIYRFSEVVANAANEFAPHYICTYLNELSSRYNKFYSMHRIADAPDSVKDFRLFLSKAVAQILANGLTILGIDVVGEM